MKILSISDVITNSSSEVFIIHGKPEFQDELNEEIPEIINNLCEAVGLDIDEILYFDICDKSGIDDNWYYSFEKNDLMIHSVSDNTIPQWLMYFIEELYYFPKLRNKFFGYYAEDIGKIELPYYDWNDSKTKTRFEEIESIQRHHLG